MKKSVLLFTALLIGITTLFAQAPDAFKYQAVARDASGDVIANQMVSITITILQGSTGGTSVYTETHDSTTNEFGLVNLNIGAGNPTSFTAIDWNNGPYFVKVEMDGSLMGTSQLLSVPYAKYADNAGNTFSGNYSDLTGTPNNVSTFTNDAGYLTGYTETDPIFGIHAANGITTTNINNWISAFGWGDHSTAGYTTTDTTLNETEVDTYVSNNGYLTSENDPIFGAHAANGITSTNITNWITAYSWGDHSTIGYTTTDTTLNETEVDNFVANNGYLTNETDPVFSTSVASDITTTDTTNWNTAFNWGDHSEAGYLTTAPTIRQSLESGNSADGAIGITGLAETSINTTGAGPDPSAILDIQSTTKGVLFPRMDSVTIRNIENPESGLMVLDTSDGEFVLRVFDGMYWRNIGQNGTDDILPPSTLILWNKLGSASEAQNSEVGPDGIIIGTVNYDNNVKFGKGVCPNTGDAGSGIDFPTTVVDPEKGCIEMWAEFYFTPTAYSYGVFGFVNNAHGIHKPIAFYWHNSNSTLGFIIKFNSTIFSANYENFSPALDTPIHIACVWDRNGIDGSGDYLRIYVDGVVVATNNTDNTWGTDTSGTFRVAAPWDSDYATDRYAVDNIKVWNYAKTDFSHRFSE